MNSRRNTGGCLASLFGLGCIAALVAALFVVLTLASPSVRTSVRGMGVPIDEIVPMALLNTFIVDDASPRITSVNEIDEDGFGFLSLNDEQKVLYKQLLDGVALLSPTFTVHGASKEDVEPAYHALMVDHPELFWVDGSTTYQFYKVAGTISITPGLSVPLDQVEGVRQQIEAAADEFLSSLPADADAYVVAKAAYEFVIDTTDYSFDASQNQNIQSVFLGHASVCAGYARAYQYLLQRAGVFCSFVEGTIPSTGEDHAWNIVRMGDEYTYVDVTWGDPTYPGLDEGREVGVVYDYLGLTTQELLRDDHMFAHADMWPSCDSTEYSYYFREGLLFDAYDEGVLSETFWREASEGRSTIVFKFTNEDAYVAAREALMNNNYVMDDIRALFQSSDRESYSYQYQYSDSLYVLKLIL